MKYLIIALAILIGCQKNNPVSIQSTDSALSKEFNGNFYSLDMNNNVGATFNMAFDGKTLTITEVFIKKYTFTKDSSYVENNLNKHITSFKFLSGDEPGGNLLFYWDENDGNCSEGGIFYIKIK